MPCSLHVVLVDGVMEAHLEAARYWRPGWKATEAGCVAVAIRLDLGLQRASMVRLALSWLKHSVLADLVVVERCEDDERQRAEPDGG